MGGPTIDASMLRPLFVMAIGFTLLFFALHMMAMRNEIWRRRVASMKKLAARNADRKRSKQIQEEGAV
jgi:heme exporter protein C